MRDRKQNEGALVRVITFNGHAVKRQKKIGDNKILVFFFNRTQQIVTPQEWEAGKQNLYYDSTVKRRDIVRTL
jgi:predicted HicB family RNase H-like nuclease